MFKVRADSFLGRMVLASQPPAYQALRAENERLQTELNQLRLIAAEMFHTFEHDTHPGYPAKQSRHVNVTNYEKWRRVIWPAVKGR